MVAPAVLMAGKALKFLPLITGTLGALPGLKKGDLGQAVAGGGIGALSGFGLGGPIRGLTAKGIRMAGSPGAVKGATNLIGRVAPNLADVPAGLVKGQLQSAAALGIPLAGIGLTSSLAGSGAGVGTAGNVGKAGVALGGYGTVGGEGMGAGGYPLPPGLGPYGMVPPAGNPLAVLDPLGQAAGMRTRSIKDAETLRDVQNILLPTVRKYAEQAKRDDFTRSMAARGIAQNIATNALLTQNMQATGLNMGQTAADQAGQALTRGYSY